MGWEGRREGEGGGGGVLTRIRHLLHEARHLLGEVLRHPLERRHRLLRKPGLRSRLLGAAADAQRLREGING